MKSKPYYFLQWACSVSVVLLTILAISSCDPDDDKKRTCRMKTVHSVVPGDDDFDTQINYSGNKISSIVFDQSSFTIGYVMTYEGDNITKVSPQSDPGTAWATFHYSNKLLDEVVYDDGFSVTLTYNASGQLTKAQYWYTDQGIKEAVYNYTLAYPNTTTRSNPMTIRYFVGQATTNPYLEDQLTYDDKINPTAEWPLALIFGISDSNDDSNAVFSSTNNITNSTISGTTTYTYNKNNYPTRVVSSDGQTDDITYECN